MSLSPTVLMRRDAKRPTSSCAMGCAAKKKSLEILQSSIKQKVQRAGNANR